MKSKLPAIPYLIWMVIFTFVPLGLVVIFAFTNDSGEFTLLNLSKITEYTSVFGKSLWLAFIATVICLVISYPLAYMISRMAPYKQSTYYMLAVLPMWINFLLRTFAWMTLLENNGLINRFFGLFGIGPFSMINTPGAVVLGMVYDYIPFMILPLYSVMVKIDDNTIQAAQDLGANTTQVMTKVVIPLSMPGIKTGITMVFVPAVSTFIISRMLGGGSSILIGDLIEQFFSTAYNLHLGSAVSLVLMIIVLVIMTATNQFDDEEVGEMIK